MNGPGLHGVHLDIGHSLKDKLGNYSGESFIVVLDQREVGVILAFSYFAPEARSIAYDDT